LTLELWVVKPVEGYFERFLPRPYRGEEQQPGEGGRGERDNGEEGFGGAAAAQ
jgi:hypothetical protein